MCSESGVSLLHMRSACHPSGSATASMMEPSNPGCSLMPPARLAHSSSMCTGTCLQTRAPTFTASSAAAWKKVRQIPSCVCPSCAQTVVFHTKQLAFFRLTLPIENIFTMHGDCFGLPCYISPWFQTSLQLAWKLVQGPNLHQNSGLHCHSLIHIMIHFIAQLHCGSQQGLL